MRAGKTVRRRPFHAGATDALGNAKDDWGDPEPVAVFGWQPGSGQASGTTTEPARDATTETLLLMAPAGTVGLHRDRWELPTGPGGATQTWDEVGDATDLSLGNPFSSFGGTTINLTRTEG